MTVTPAPPELCTRIRHVRERVLGISQEEAARRLGLSLKAYRAYETFREPKISRLRQLAVAFGLEETHFLDPESRAHSKDELDDTLARRHEELVARLDAQDEALRLIQVELERLRARPG